LVSVNRQRDGLVYRLDLAFQESQVPFNRTGDKWFVGRKVTRLLDRRCIDELAASAYKVRQSKLFGCRWWSGRRLHGLSEP
jgi:hypothetical protein